MKNIFSLNLDLNSINKDNVFKKKGNKIIRRRTEKICNLKKKGKAVL